MKLIDRKDSVSAHGEFTEERVRIIKNTDDLALVIANTRPESERDSPIALFSRADPTHRAIVEGTLTSLMCPKFPCPSRGAGTSRTNWKGNN